MSELSLGAALFAYLPDVLSTDERLYPLTLPQNATLPAHVYQIVSDDPLLTHSDAQDNQAYTGFRYEQTRVQFSTWGSTYDDADQASNELRTVITGARGLWGDVSVESVLPLLSLDDFEPTTGLYRRVCDYTISWHGGPGGS